MGSLTVFLEIELEEEKKKKVYKIIIKLNSSPVLHKSPKIPCKRYISGKFRKLLVALHIKRVSRENANLYA